MNEQKSMHCNLPNLCEDCLNAVTRKTLDRQEVINALADAGRGFCSHLNYDIIPRDTAQTIESAENDSAALGIIRRALQNSLVPDKLNHVLERLRVKKMGTEIHSEKIKKSFHEVIRQHKRCEKCKAQPVSDDIQPSIGEYADPGEDIKDTTQPPVTRPRVPNPQPVPDNIQPRISEDVKCDQKRENREQHQYQGLEAEGCAYTPQQYYLLEELTTEQKTSRPKERLFASIANCVQSVPVLGIHLGFKLKQVRNFQSDNCNSVQDQVIEMLDAWRRKKKVQVTVERLIKALQKSKIPEQSYRQDVLDYFNGSDDDTDTEDSSED